MALKILSDGTDVASTARTRFVTMAICSCSGSTTVNDWRRGCPFNFKLSVEVFSDESYYRKFNFRRLLGISDVERRSSSARLRGRPSSRDSRRSSVTLR